jgi:hypothetical protein
MADRIGKPVYTAADFEAAFQKYVPQLVRRGRRRRSGSGDGEKGLSTIIGVIMHNHDHGLPLQSTTLLVPSGTLPGEACDTSFRWPSPRRCIECLARRIRDSFDELLHDTRELLGLRPSPKPHRPPPFKLLRA